MYNMIAVVPIECTFLTAITHMITVLMMESQMTCNGIKLKRLSLS